MTGFTKQPKLTAEAVDELKKQWNMWNCGNWFAVHKVTRKQIKCGTYSALLEKLQWER
jgi:hypothetical protein